MSLYNFSNTLTHVSYTVEHEGFQKRLTRTLKHIDGKFGTVGIEKFLDLFGIGAIVAVVTKKNDDITLMRVGVGVPGASQICVYVILERRRE